MKSSHGHARSYTSTQGKPATVGRSPEQCGEHPSQRVHGYSTSSYQTAPPGFKPSVTGGYANGSSQNIHMDTYTTPADSQSAMNNFHWNSNQSAEQLGDDSRLSDNTGYHGYQQRDPPLNLNPSRRINISKNLL